MTPAGQATFSRYTAQRSRIRNALDRSVQREFDATVDPDELADTFERTAIRVAPVIRESQRRTALATGGFLRIFALATSGRLVEPVVPDLAGETVKGLPLTEGMAALGPMVLASIAEGKSLDEALDFGRHLFGRFADAETTRIADEVMEAQPERLRIVGWEGIVSANACGPCTAENSGTHPLDWEPYRHGNCACERVPIFEGET